MLGLLATFFLQSQGKPTAIELIQDRPLTWDWQGTIPLSIDGGLDRKTFDLLAQMRQGEYLHAYVDAKSDLISNPSHLIDTWIMAECERKRKDVNQILLDSDSILSKSRTTAALLLRVRAYGLVAAQGIRNLNQGIGRASDNQKSVSDSYTAQASLLKELERAAATEISVLVAELTYPKGGILPTRMAANALAAKHPRVLDYQLMVVRTLIRGDYGFPVLPDGKLGRGRAGPGETAPKYDQALNRLDSIEKEFKKQPLIDYYRAVAWAMKAEIADPARVDVEAARNKALSISELFLVEGSNYPRLVAATRDYIAHGHVGWFFPPKDE